MTTLIKYTESDIVSLYSLSMIECDLYHNPAYSKAWITKEVQATNSLDHMGLVLTNFLNDTLGFRD